MKKKILNESEMVKAVKEIESGVDATTVAREHGVSKATLNNWKSKYSGMDVSQVTRLKELEEENRKLNQMYSELALDNRILKEGITNNLEPQIKRELADEIVEEYDVSIARASKMMDIHRSYFNYREKRDDTEVEEAIRAAVQYGDGFWQIFKVLHRDVIQLSSTYLNLSQLGQVGSSWIKLEKLEINCTGRL